MCHPPRARSGRRGGAMTDVVIVDSGVANLASIASAFRRLGANVVVTGDEGVVQDAPRVVLPGVGAFGAGLGALRARRLDEAVTQAAARGTPLLGVCLGMQMLCEASEEAPGVTGLGVIPGICRRLPEDVRVPHLGWNAVTAAGEGLVATGVAAFANSYALREAPAGWVPAWTTHGVRFVAALEKSGERLLACQFHPELSGAYGAAIRIPLTVGGGVRSVDDARRLLAAGADKVSVNTPAVQRPALLSELAAEFGSQCVVLAIDARRTGNGWEALTHGGRQHGRPDAVGWAQEAVGLGAEEFRAGADAVLAASVFHDGDETVDGIKADLSLRGIRVRR